MKGFSIGLIIALALIIGALSYFLYCKRREDIIKVLIRRDLLPQAAPGTEWMQGGVCCMADGSFGKVVGNYCELIQPL